MLTITPALGNLSVSTDTGLSLTIPSGATLGHASGRVGRLYYYSLGALLAVSCRYFGKQGIAPVISALSASSSDCMSLYASIPVPAGASFSCIGMSRDAQAVAGQWNAAPIEIVNDSDRGPAGAFHAYPSAVISYGNYARLPLQADTCEYNTGEYDTSANRWCVQPEEPGYWSLHGSSCWDRPGGGSYGSWFFILYGDDPSGCWRETAGDDRLCVQNNPQAPASVGSDCDRIIFLRPIDSVSYFCGHAFGKDWSLTPALGSYGARQGDYAYVPNTPPLNTINYFEGSQLPALI